MRVASDLPDSERTSGSRWVAARIDDLTQVELTAGQGIVVSKTQPPVYKCSAGEQRRVCKLAIGAVTH